MVSTKDLGGHHGRLQTRKPSAPRGRPEGIWLAARRLHQGKFIWPKDAAPTLSLNRPQFDALVLGLPWQRVGEAGVICVL